MDRSKKVATIVPRIILFSCISLAVVLPGRVLAKEFPAGTPREARIKVRDLERTLGKSSADGRQVLTKPYDEKSLDVLLDALDSPHATVRARATHLMRLVVEQLDPPQNALDEIARTVKPLSGQEITDDMDARKHGPNWEQGEAVLGARRILWQIGLKTLKTDQLRLAFFRDQLLGENADSVDPYLKIRVVEYLSDMAVEEAKATLEDYLQASDRMHPVGRRRVKRGIQRIIVSRSLQPLKPAAKVSKLTQILEESPDLGMRIWAVREMGEVASDTAISKLQSIFDTEQYDVRLRYEAQQALKVLGILPENVYRIARP